MILTSTRSIIPLEKRGSGLFGPSALREEYLSEWRTKIQIVICKAQQLTDSTRDITMSIIYNLKFSYRYSVSSFHPLCATSYNGLSLGPRADFTQRHRSSYVSWSSGVSFLWFLYRTPWSKANMSFRRDPRLTAPKTFLYTVCTYARPSGKSGSSSNERRFCIMQKRRSIVSSISPVKYEVMLKTMQE